MSDVVYNSVEFKNFMSFGNLPTTVKLDEPGTTLIVGENLDDGGSSGAGKTTLISAISYCLYDKIPSGVSKDRLINQTNEKKNTSMEVKLTFTTNGHVYTVSRKRGAQGALLLLEDGKDITPATSSAFNEKIEELHPFSYMLFSQIILFNGNSRPFLDFSVTDQRTLIEELFRVTTLSKKANACKRRVSETDKDIGLQKLLIKQQEQQNETHRRHVAEAKDRAARWEVQHEADLNNLANAIQKHSEIDFDTEQSLHDEATRLGIIQAPLQAELDGLKAQLKTAENNRFPRKTELALLESAATKLSLEIKKQRTELTHLEEARCPYCLQEFLSAGQKIDDLKEKIEGDQNEIELTEDQIVGIKNEEKIFEKAKSDEILVLKQQIEVKQSKVLQGKQEIDEIYSALVYKSLKDLLMAKNGVASTQEKLMKAYSETNPHLESVKSLEAEGEIKIDRDGLEAMITLQEHQQFLVKLLMDKNSFIRKNIISKTVPFLNKRIGYYTEKLNLPHMALFQPDMSCEISQYGRVLDHGNLSNGEKKRLNIALCLAFRDVLTYLHAKINVLFTDEIDGGSLDSNCVDSLIQLLKRKAWDEQLGIYVISHRPEFEGRCDRNLVVRKDRGFSNLIAQPDA